VRYGPLLVTSLARCVVMVSPLWSLAYLIIRLEYCNTICSCDSGASQWAFGHFLLLYIIELFVATSSMVAEYVSAYPSVQKVICVRRAVLHYLELTRDKPTTLLIDSKRVPLISPTTPFTLNVQRTLTSSTTGYEIRLQMVQLLWFMLRLQISVPIF
jgi:hypothetical protein